MKLLEKENWWIWLLLAFLSGGSSVLILGALLGIYNKEAWYYRWMERFPKWIVIFILVLMVIVVLVPTFGLPLLMLVDLEQISEGAILSLGIGAIIYMMLSFALFVFQTQILVQVNAKLGTPGSEIYLSPYIWILGLIIPVVGWIILVVMYIYLQIWYLVMLYRGYKKKKEKIYE